MFSTVSHTLKSSCQVLTAHSSSGDGHVVPVAGWPLGATVAAQVLVDPSHLVSGRIVKHLKAWVVAVRLGATHVHFLQQVLAVHHSDLSEGDKYSIRSEKPSFEMLIWCQGSSFNAE